MQHTYMQVLDAQVPDGEEKLETATLIASLTATLTATCTLTATHTATHIYAGARRPTSRQTRRN